MTLLTPTQKETARLYEAITSFVVLSTMYRKEVLEATAAEIKSLLLRSQEEEEERKILQAMLDYLLNEVEHYDD